ncbi:cystathionine beta-lyase [Alkalibaculum bacchi]|uniref:cysteine-S-conjugate beta-lyase n=1 Tax=Alkalibaculum bacchi TaxID=645887 RepID=A0A366I8L3_9FIRM|nr:MalY/PatB family protein [Alkalibaculum bacchi]RBP64470.1 cystathionine beta-lyase [Alkalibaculum bacchi]
MTYNFDEIIDRKNTNSLKYDFAVERGKPEDILPLWVADMDFRVPPAVAEALVKSSEHGIFGYSDTKNEYFQTLYNWYLSRFNFEIKKDWLVKTPGVVYAISTAVRALTKEGDAIIIQQPVYYPFSGSIQANNRKLINNSLIYKNGSYHMDLEDFEKKIIENNVRLFILCSPHNPVGRVWTKEELIDLGDICVKHNVIVVADEIHADFVYKDHKHHVFANLKPEYLDNSIICTAPSKTFNLAGLQVSNIFIANKDIRRAFIKEIDRTGYSQLNTMGLIACQAAYEYGGEWLEELKEYLSENLSFIRSFLAEHLPQIKLVEPEGTYLVWLDCRDLGLSEQELEELIVNKAKLWLDGGTMFGKDGENFQRVNIACPRSILEQAFEQLREALKNML